MMILNDIQISLEFIIKVMETTMDFEGGYC